MYGKEALTNKFQVYEDLPEGWQSADTDDGKRWATCSVYGVSIVCDDDDNDGVIVLNLGTIELLVAVAF